MDGDTFVVLSAFLQVQDLCSCLRVWTRWKHFADLSHCVIWKTMLLRDFGCLTFVHAPHALYKHLYASKLAHTVVVNLHWELDVLNVPGVELSRDCWVASSPLDAVLELSLEYRSNIPSECTFEISIAGKVPDQESWGAGVSGTFRLTYCAREHFFAETPRDFVLHISDGNIMSFDSQCQDALKSNGVFTLENQQIQDLTCIVQFQYQRFEWDEG
jgi:hypothetical protein